MPRHYRAGLIGRHPRAPQMVPAQETRRAGRATRSAELHCQITEPIVNVGLRTCRAALNNLMPQAIVLIFWPKPISLIRAAEVFDHRNELLSCCMHRI